MPEKKLPQELIDFWPEVFEDIEIDVIPVEYLHSVIITFEDGVTWNVDLTDESKNQDIESALHDLVEEYNDSICNLDFRLDIEKIKKDVSKRTNSFLKKRK